MKSPPKEGINHELKEQRVLFSRLNIGIGVDIEMQQFPILILKCQSEQHHYKDKEIKFLLAEEVLDSGKEMSREILKDRGKGAEFYSSENWNSKYINILSTKKETFSNLLNVHETSNANPLLEEIKEHQENKEVRKFKIFCPTCQNAPCKTIINSDYINNSIPHEEMKKAESILLFCLRMASDSNFPVNFASSSNFIFYSLFCSCCERESILVLCQHRDKQVTMNELLPFFNQAKRIIMQLRESLNDMENELDLNEVLLFMSESERYEKVSDAELLKQAFDFCVEKREKMRIDKKKLTQATQDTEKLITKCSKLEKKHSQESEFDYSINLDKVSNKSLIYKLKNGRRLVSERGFQNRELNLGNFSMTCEESVHKKNKNGGFRNSEKLENTKKGGSWEKKKKLSIASFQTEILRQKAKKDNLHFLKENDYIVTKQQKIINNLQASHQKYSPFSNILNESYRIENQTRKLNYWKEIEEISNSVMIVSEKNKTEREETPQKIILTVPEKKLEQIESPVKVKKEGKAENSKKTKRNSTHFDGEEEGSQLIFAVEEKKKIKSSLKHIPENHYGKVKERTGTKSSIRFIPEEENEPEEKIKYLTKSSIKCIPEQSNIEEVKKGETMGLKENGGSCKSLRHKRVSFSVKSIAENTEKSSQKSTIILKFEEVWREVEKEIQIKINPIGTIINEIKEVFKKEAIKSFTELFLLYKKFFYIRTTLLSNLIDADEPMVTCCSLSEWREVLELKEHKNKINELERENSLILETLNKMHKKVACRTEKSIDFTKEPHIYDITIDSEDVYDKFIKKMVRMNAKRFKEVYKLTASKETDRRIVHKYWKTIILASLDELGNSEYQRAFNWIENANDENSDQMISQVDALVSFINEI